MARKRRRRENPLCAYCGVREGSTDEHIVPEGFFAPGRINLVTVRCCHECNNGKSDDDTYLQQMIMMDDAVFHHPLVRAKLNDKVVRAIARNRSIVARDAVKKGIFVAAHREHGEYINDGFAMPLAEERISRSFKAMTRGLTFHQYGLRIPDDHVFLNERLRGEKIQETIDEFRGFGLTKPGEIGKGEFEYLGVIHSAPPLLTMWLICFYETIFFRLASFPAGTDWSAELLRVAAENEEKSLAIIQPAD